MRQNSINAQEHGNFQNMQRLITLSIQKYEETFCLLSFLPDLHFDARDFQNSNFKCFKIALQPTLTLIIKVLRSVEW